MSFRNYSTTPSLNTAIAGQNTAPGGPPSAVGPSLRQLAADGKELADRVIFAKDFGVKADGTTNDTAALQSAIASALNAPRTTLDLGETGDISITGITLSGGTSLTIKGRGARLVTASATPALSISGVENVTLDGVRVAGNSGISVNPQHGIYLDTVGRARVVNCHIENFSAGIWVNNVSTGYITGGYQLPSEISGNIIKGCYNGIYTEDQSAGHYGEYCRISNNTITDCLNWGINSHAGNTSIVNNTVNGNKGGILVISTGAINGDHGMIVANTVNHNKRCGIYVKDLLRSLLIANNNVWATLGDGTSDGYLEPTGDFAETFGIVLNNVRCVNLLGNVLGRNRTALGLKQVSETRFADNILLSSSDATAYRHIADFSDFALTNSNSCGPNIISGTVTTGAATGDPCARRTPSFLNGWLAYGGGFSTPAFWKDGNNVVHLEGLIKSGTLANSAFTLPLGFRPVAGDLSFGVSSNSAFGVVQVTTAGSVTPASGSTVWVSLDGISFKAAA